MMDEAAFDALWHERAGDDAQLAVMLEDSYELVVDRLPPATRRRIALARGGQPGTPATDG